MTKSTLEAEAILKRAAPLTHQQAHEIQSFGHLVRTIVLKEARSLDANTRTI